VNLAHIFADEGEAFTCADAIEACEFGWFQIRLSFFAGLLWVSETEIQDYERTHYV
jgi:hypothetical protein